MNALVWLPAELDDRAVARRVVASDVHGYPLCDYSVTRFRPGLILGFAGVSDGQLPPGLRRLADLIAILKSNAKGLD